MSINIVVNGAHSATTYTGDGAALTNLARANLAADTVNSVCINNGSGLLSNLTHLSPALGGTGTDLSGVGGPAIMTVTGGAVEATLAYSETNTNNSLVQRDSNGNIACTAGTFTTVTTGTLSTASGDLSISPSGSNINVAAKTLLFVPTTGSSAQVLTTEVQTTNAIATTILSFATTSGGTHGTTYSFDILVALGDITGGVNTGSYHMEFIAKNIGGTLTISDHTVQSILDTGLSTTSISTTASTSNVLVQVTGVAATTIGWTGIYKIVSQNF